MGCTHPLFLGTFINTFILFSYVTCMVVIITEKEVTALTFSKLKFWMDFSVARFLFGKIMLSGPFLKILNKYNSHFSPLLAIYPI